jgi:hypothetical protein
VLSALGEEGWELVSITPNSIAYLKREIEGGEPTQSQTEKAGEVVSGVKPKYRNPVTCGVHDVYMGARVHQCIQIGAGALIKST